MERLARENKGRENRGIAMAASKRYYGLIAPV